MRNRTGRRDGRKLSKTGAWCLAVAAVSIACEPTAEQSTTGITAPSLEASEADPTTTVIDARSEDDGSPQTRVELTACEYTINEDLPLERCDTGVLVERTQAELASTLGLELGIDGYFGDQTLSAVLRFQEERGLEADGLVGTETWNALFGSNLSERASTRGIAENWFGEPYETAVAGLRDQGFLVVDYEICSGSVGPGEVRQIQGGDGTVYLDENGVTVEGEQLLIGAVVEVMYGSGTAC